MKKYLFLSLLVLTLTGCVSSKVFNDLESRYASLKGDYNDQLIVNGTLTKNLANLESKLFDLNADLKNEQVALKSNIEKLELLQNSYDALAENSDSELKERIAENELLLKKIGERENELEERITRVEELETLISNQQEAMQMLKKTLADALLNFEDKGLTVEARDGKVYVSMENKLLFKSGSWEVESEGKKAISSLGKVLAENPDISILIEGHTDNVPYQGKGPLKGNWDLSTKRATSIVTLLLTHKEILPQNLTAAGRGEFLPVAPNSSKNGRAINRRIEVVLSPKLDEITQLLNTID
jgi:chemotaxis protein MotB